MATTHFRRLAAMMLALLAGAGCHSEPAPLVPVHGRITYQGDPLGEGTIVFVPDTSCGFRGPLAHAVIDAQGNYTLRTGETPGAAVGWYRVTVAAVAAPATVGGHKYDIPLSLLPEKYRSPDLSGLRCEVKADRDNRIDFNLE
jgi:hypothetical protein